MAKMLSAPGARNMPHSIIVGNKVSSLSYFSLPTAGTEITCCLCAIIVPLCSVKSYKTEYGTYLSEAYHNSFRQALYKL